MPRNSVLFVALLGLFALMGLGIAGLFYGGLWLSAKLLFLGYGLAGLGVAVLTVGVLPAALFTRRWGWVGRGMIYVSYAWAAALWMWATVVLYRLWGAIGLFLGLILLGVGSLPMAGWALVVHREFRVFGGMLLGVFAVFFLYSLGSRLSTEARS